MDIELLELASNNKTEVAMKKYRIRYRDHYFAKQISI